MTGHNEVVMIVFDPGQVTFQVAELFGEPRPYSGMRQGNDIGAVQIGHLRVFQPSAGTG